MLVLEGGRIGSAAGHGPRCLYLRVSKRGIRLEAPAAAGLRYGLQTLVQLAAAGPHLPLVTIEDQPDFRDRGLMIDVSRGKVPTSETLERIVDLSAQLRLNVLMLYVEHPFDFKRHPEIGEGASPLSAETLLSLDRYAKVRGVELIPASSRWDIWSGSSRSNGMQISPNRNAAGLSRLPSPAPTNC